MTRVMDAVQAILESRYELRNRNLSASLARLGTYLKTMRQDLHVLVEHPYVDKDYRDTYYHYYATKNSAYSRNSIRLSFFLNSVEETHFRDPAQFDAIQSGYLGFLSVRPTFPKVIGRSVIDKRAFSKDDCVICPMPLNATANGLKLDVTGFPHSSQDGEATTCAETTLWSVLQYFGNKYAEHAPVLPSQASKVLTQFSVERIVPSKGLQAGQVSYAFKEFGFGVKIYSKAEYGYTPFFQLIRMYVESGIPVIGFLSNGSIGHAISIVGRAKPSAADIASLPETDYPDGLKVSEFADLDIEYVFMDDNHAPYRTGLLSNPAKAYEGVDDRFKGCELIYFLVPLHRRVYLEAGSARTQVISLLTSPLKPFTNKSILIRTFLSSSRSFKHAIASNPTMDPDAKEFLIHASMPKFVWVAEISDKTLIANGEAHSLVVLDATEPKQPSIIAAMFNGTCVYRDLTSEITIALPLRPYSIMGSNLQ